MLKKNLPIWLIAVELGFVSACHTARKRNPSIQLPPAIESLFSSCLSGDGALLVRAEDGGRDIGSAEAEWIASEQRGWQLEMMDPVGGTLLYVDYRKPSIKFDGALAHRFEDLSLDHSGFFVWDDSFLGIRAAEMPCYLSAKLPRSWLANMYSYKRDRDQIVVEFAQKRRSLSLTIAYPNGEFTSYCANLSWYNMLLFKSVVKICSNKKSGTISGIEDFVLHWRDIDTSQ